jgi:hypothetical protein
MPRGNPWSDPKLIFNPQFYLDVDGKTCDALSYQGAVPLMIAPEGMWQACKAMK